MADEQQQERGFIGYFIPEEIVNDHNLRPTDKLLLAEIHSLSKRAPEYACWASNEHLAKRVGLKTRSVHNAITRLRKLGYIDDVSFDGRRRLIRACIYKFTLGASTSARRVHSQVHQDISKNTDKNIIGSKSRFSAPALEMICAYGREIGISPEQCEAFRDHHQTRGWILGRGNKMKDWQAALRTWKRNIPVFAPKKKFTAPPVSQYSDAFERKWAEMEKRRQQKGQQQ